MHTNFCPAPVVAVKALFIDDANKKVSLPSFSRNWNNCTKCIFKTSMMALSSTLIHGQDHLIVFVLSVEGNLSYNEQMVVINVKSKDE